jgi:hypothetical protein
MKFKIAAVALALLTIGCSEELEKQGEEFAQAIVDEYEENQNNQDLSNNNVDIDINGTANLNRNTQVSVYKYANSIQCDSNSGLSLNDMAAELEDFSVGIACSVTLNDGLERIAACGASTGDINVFKIQKDSLEQAENLGYINTNTLTSTTINIDCDEINKPQPVTLDNRVIVYKPAETINCMAGSGISVADMQQDLIQADIAVYCSQRDLDGALYTESCGSDNGDINVFEIHKNDVLEAENRGFMKIESLRTANVTMQCD